jgi:hypothetical protein
MKKLLNAYGFTYALQYYEMVATSFINGQISQARTQFKALPKGNKIELLHSIDDGTLLIEPRYKQLLIEDSI